MTCRHCPECVHPCPKSATCWIGLVRILPNPPLYHKTTNSAVAVEAVFFMMWNRSQNLSLRVIKNSVASETVWVQRSNNGQFEHLEKRYSTRIAKGEKKWAGIEESEISTDITWSYAGEDILHLNRSISIVSSRWWKGYRKWSIICMSVAY